MTPQHPAHRQRGGTILGIILGIVLGLGVAVAVALYVAKVPMPFEKKTATRNGERSHDWDPNAGLRGGNGSRSSGGSVSAPPPTPAPAPERTPSTAPAPVPDRASPPPAVAGRSAPPAERDSADPRPPAVAGRAAQPSQPAPSPATPAPSAQRPSADPVGDLIAARTSRASPQSQPAAGADPFTYFVQAGAYRLEHDADAQRARLSLLGIEARVTEREQAGQTVYRVRVGPFQNKDAADRVKERLDGSGFDAALVRVAR